MFSAVAVSRSTLHCQATMPSVRLKIDVVGTGGGEANRPSSTLSTALAARELIYPPCIRRTRVAPERRTQGDDASNVIRHCLRHFACINAAEAPTDQRNLPAGFGA